jgi:hypothetical protein
LRCLDGGYVVNLFAKLRHAPRVRTLAALAMIAAYYIVWFRSCVLTFFAFDDFRIMRDAASLQMGSLAGFAELLRPRSPNGFYTYRPLSQKGYFYLLQQLFGYDASAYHAFQLLICALNATLVFLIARRVSRSTLAGLLGAILYAAAPGHVTAIYWLAAFSMTGSALVVLAAVYFWLTTDGLIRAIGCAILQVVGLLTGEYAVAIPVLLAIAAVFGPRHEDRHRAVRDLTVPVLIVAAYVGAKLYYVAKHPFMAIMGVSYNPTFDALGWVARLGHYATACFSASAWAGASTGLGTGGFLVIGVTTIALTGLAVWQTLRGRSRWRLLAFGSSAFVAGLLPVLPLHDQFANYYIGVAAMGSALAAVGVCQLAGDSWRRVAVAMVAMLLVVDMWVGPWAHVDPKAKLIVEMGTRSAEWIASVQAAARSGFSAVSLPRGPVTRSTFGKARAQEFFPPTTAVALYDPARPAEPAPGKAVLRKPTVEIHLGDPLPGWQQRWGWLRRYAGADHG